LNDNFDANKSEWEALSVATEKAWNYKKVENAELPEKLFYGMEDQGYSGWNHVMRAQALINLQNNKGLPHLDADGVYGAKTVKMVKAIYGGDGRTITFENLKKLHGLM
jgi:hypothetical protein